MRYDIAAKPTRLRTVPGVTFRSVLEAKWASLFDAQGCEWEYADRQWHDFVVDGIHVEVKPSVRGALSAVLNRACRFVAEGGAIGVAIGDPFGEHRYCLATRTNDGWAVDVANAAPHREVAVVGFSVSHDLAVTATDPMQHELNRKRRLNRVPRPILDVLAAHLFPQNRMRGTGDG